MRVEGLRPLDARVWAIHPPPIEYRAVPKSPSIPLRWPSNRHVAAVTRRLYSQPAIPRTCNPRKNKTGIADRPRVRTLAECSLSRPRRTPASAESTAANENSLAEPARPGTCTRDRQTNWPRRNPLVFLPSPAEPRTRAYARWWCQPQLRAAPRFVHD